MPVPTRLMAIKAVVRSERASPQGNVIADADVSNNFAALDIWLSFHHGIMR